MGIQHVSAREQDNLLLDACTDQINRLEKGSERDSKIQKGAKGSLRPSKHKSLGVYAAVDRVQPAPPQRQYNGPDSGSSAGSSSIGPQGIGSPGVGPSAGRAIPGTSAIQSRKSPRRPVRTPVNKSKR
jgi:hypothetical protein